MGSGPSLYVEEIVVGSAAREAIDLNLSPTENLHRIAEALKCKVSDLTVFVLDKPRHETLISELNAAGARAKINSGGFVVGALLAAMPGTGVDVMMSIGRASEAMLAACAVKAVDGGMQIRRAPQTAEEELRVRSALGRRASQILTEADVCKSEDVFLAATGITDGGLLHGVDFQRDGVTTESLVMRARSGTIRYVRAIHRLDKLMRFSQIDYTGDGYNTKDVVENHG
jgi:fructose-1,6-bisphosphatase II